MQYLNLGGNQLTDSIPPELGQLTNLRVLSLSQNQLTGPIPPELGQLVRLNELYLEDTQLTGAIPPQLGQLVGLHYLSLQNNQLTGCATLSSEQISPDSDSSYLSKFLTVPSDRRRTGVTPASDSQSRTQSGGQRLPTDPVAQASLTQINMLGPPGDGPSVEESLSRLRTADGTGPVPVPDRPAATLRRHEGRLAAGGA